MVLSTVSSGTIACPWRSMRPFSAGGLQKLPPGWRRKPVALRQKIYGDKVYTRGLIEISNLCKNDCLYCGHSQKQPEL